MFGVHASACLSCVIVVRASCLHARSSRFSAIPFNDYLEKMSLLAIMEML
jgi:hypothetical protein